MTITQGPTTVVTQPDGPGLRIDRKGELTVVAEVVPGGADKLRANLAELQADAFVYEPRVGTVDNFRVVLINDDTQLLATVVYDGDFLPYVADILTFAGPWLDRILDGVVADYPGAADHEKASRWVLERSFPASIFFHSHPDATTRDVTKMKKLSTAITDLLDAAE